MSAAILNAGAAAWIFEKVAARLSELFEVPVRSAPAQFNYVLGWEGEALSENQSFIPFGAIDAATDKRALAEIFVRNGVPTPETHLIETETELRAFLRRESWRRWLLKWPTGCGAAGHRFVQTDDELPTDWPRPFVVQEFIEMQRPEVFRIYGVTHELFGWNARRFADEGATSHFVAHALGAHYENGGEAPAAALEAAQSALEATNLLSSFGCADLLRDEHGRFLVLEVNTDGRWMHVDRDTLPEIQQDMQARLQRAFWVWAGRTM